MAATSRTTPKTFEEASAELEQLVRQMESGQLSLDEMILAFERGNTLVKFCNEKLTEVQQRVLKITAAKDGSVSREQFQ